MFEFKIDSLDYWQDAKVYRDQVLAFVEYVKEEILSWENLSGRIYPTEYSAGFKITGSVTCDKRDVDSIADDMIYIINDELDIPQKYLSVSLMQGEENSYYLDFDFEEVAHHYIID